MATDAQDLALPGFDEFLKRDADRAGETDFRSGNYTAVRVRREYPGTYESCAVALFKYKLAVNTCAELFHMNPATVAGIRDMVIAEAPTSSRASFLVNNRRRVQKEIANSRLVELLLEKLQDKETRDKLSVSEITDLIKKLEAEPPARNGTDAECKHKSDGEIIDVDEFDDATSTNGFDAEKKIAPIRQADSTPETIPDNGAAGAVGTEDCGSTTVELSNNHQ